VWWNSARLVAPVEALWPRAVIVGAPMPVSDWFAEHMDLFDLPDRAAGAGAKLCDRVMSRIGALIPVTPVPLACAAIQSFDRDFIPQGSVGENG
jgi:hypothetical protein